MEIAQKYDSDCCIKHDIRIMTLRMCTLVLINKNGHNFWLEGCSSVSFETCFEFPAKSLKDRNVDTSKIWSSAYSCIIQQIIEFSLKGL